MFESILIDSTGTLSISNALFCTMVSLLLGIMIAFIYMKTNRHYTQNFVITLSLLPLLVEVVIMMVNGNLGTSVAIMGAFALIRFRSMPASAKEIMYVFLAMAVGLSVGMGYLTFAITFTVLACLVLFILEFFQFGKPKEFQKLLRITIPENLDYTNVFDDLFARYIKVYELTRVKTTNMGSLFELTYQITIKSNCNEKEFIDELRCRNGNLPILIHREEMEITEL